MIYVHKVRWEIDEAVAIVNLYYKYKNNEISDLETELRIISKMLNKRADILEIKHDDKFRNYTGVKMIFYNVNYVDSNGEEGLSCASKMIYEAVDMYKNNYGDFQKVLNDFENKYSVD